MGPETGAGNAPRDPDPLRPGVCGRRGAAAAGRALAGAAMRICLPLAAVAILLPAAGAETLTRVATVPLQAEITGLHEHGGDLFLNIQHPKADIASVHARASIGIIDEVDWAAPELAPARTAAEKIVARTSLGRYRVLLQAGDFGRVGVIRAMDGETLLVSRNPDFNAFIPAGEDTGFLFTNWESRPGGMSRARLERDAEGRWQVAPDGVEMVDFAGVRGTWVNCFGSVSPWGTPLSAEELYFDETADWNNPEYRYIEENRRLARYLGHWPNPYDYGYIVEITAPATAATPVKRFALGRFSHENAVVMPDRKTAYLSDDAAGAVFFKFIADTAGDLNSGTLYAAQVTQDGTAGAPAAGTAFDLRWIRLAHGTGRDIEGWIRAYDGIGLDDHVPGENSYISDAEIEAWARGEAADDRVAFLESRKAAVARGASGEFHKMEAVNVNLAGAGAGTVPFLYLAMSDVSGTMSDGEGAIDVAGNRCGVVYEMRLDPAFDVARMVPVVAGQGADPDAGANACPLDSIANPDNLIVRADGSVVIGEDSDRHENNALWIWRRAP